MSESGELPVSPDPAALRYAGEEIVDRVDLGETQVAVTTHRVLVSTPDGPGCRFRSVYRPNVVGVERGVHTDESAGRRTLQAGVYAVLLSTAGVLFDVDGLVTGVDPAGTEGLGGATVVIGRLLTLLALLDDLLLAAGVIAGATAVAFAGRYLQQRDREFRIEVAGDDPITLAVQGREGVAAERLRAAISGKTE